MTDPYASLNNLYATFGEVVKAVNEASQGRTEYERERAMFSVVSAYSLAEEMWIFKADPARPVFSDWMANGRKTAGDSPYTIYLSAPIHPGNTYRLYGKVGQPTYFGIQIYKRIQGFNAVLAEKCHPCRDQPLPPLGYPFGGPNATGLPPLRLIPLVQG